ncbi:hypothetical protein ABVK25_008782 [Lepraria finkii]|uniref:Uncharacterized protein n=1 Tax=Lepraria finkii TaxID=1340010 RepID=A0ABR4B1W5_9LECA
MKTPSDRDLALMKGVLKSLTGDIDDLVNFENVAKKYGYKDKSNARTCFRCLIQKISGAEGAGAMTKSTLTKRGFVAANDDEVEDGEVAAPKTAKRQIIAKEERQL